MILKGAALASLRQRHANYSTAPTDATRSFFAGHLGNFHNDI